MANEALLIYKKAGLSEESDWAQGSITNATKLLPLRDSGVAIGLSPQQIMPNRLTGRAGRREMILGTISPSMTVPMFGYPVGVSLLAIKAGLGQVTSTEVASFTVTINTNDFIDFTEDGGAEKNAQIAAGSYAAGTSSAQAGTLCAAIKTAMEAVGDGTYTVTFSTSTKKFTITEVGETVTAFVIKWATGTNNAKAADTLLGFAADTVSGASATSATALEIVYSHAFTVKEALDYGQSKGLTAQIGLADGKVFDILDGVVNALNVSYAPNQELYIDAIMPARRVDASIATLAGLTEPAVVPMTFTQLSATIDGDPAVLSALAIEFNNNLKMDLFANSQYRTRFVRGGFREVTGSLSFDITDSRTYALYDSFRLDSAGIPVVATFEGAVIKGSSKYSIAFSMPLVKPNFDNVPGGGGADAPAGEVPFVALHDGTNAEMSVTVVNNEPSV